jgi:hypothetical protein
VKDLIQFIVAFVVLPLSVGYCQEAAPVICYETRHPHCLNFTNNEESTCDNKSCIEGISNGQEVVICDSQYAFRTANNVVPRATPVKKIWALDSQTPMTALIVCTIRETCGCDTRVPLPSACENIQTTHISDILSNTATGEPCRDLTED